MVEDRTKRSVKWGSTIGTAVLVLLLFVLFIFAVKWFRTKPEQEDAIVSSIVDVLKPDPISQALIDGAIDTQSRDASLYWVSTRERVGVATRGKKDDHYYLEIKTSLPEIDRETHYYQAWLLRRLPYGYFSIGEMITDEDGYFVLDWEAPDDEDYAGYTEIILTVNAYVESPDPGTHKVEGSFGD